MKKTIIILIILLIAFNLIGCAKCTNIEYQEVEVEIVDKYHRGMIIIPHRINNIVYTTTIPAKYEITVKYNGIEYSIDNTEIYYKYKDKIGQKAIGVLEIKTYDNTIKYDINKVY